MHIFTIALAVTILVPLATPVSAWPGRCSSNAACPSGSECVDNFCVVCSVDQAKCQRSVDRCKAMNCANDEGCYVSEKANADGTVTLKPVCSKTNPCAGASCSSGHCETVVIGNQPPFAQCRPNTPVNPCDGVNCPAGTRCLTRVGLCGQYPCLLQGICVSSSDCVMCNYFYQYCDITVANNTVKGNCLNFIHLFGQRPFAWGK